MIVATDHENLGSNPVHVGLPLALTSIPYSELLLRNHSIPLTVPASIFAGDIHSIDLI